MERHGKRILVMEYFDGCELYHLINRQSLAPPLICRIMLQLALAIEHCHAQGVVHGDVKPENILVQPATGKLKLIDFGLARPMGRLCRGLWGSVEYAAPEMRRDEPYDPLLAEMWTCGVVLFTMIYRQLPCDMAFTPMLRQPMTLFKPLLHDLLNPVPENRPSASTLVKTLQQLSPLVGQ
jgi:serine/threonine protein kinase